MKPGNSPESPHYYDPEQDGLPPVPGAPTQAGIRAWLLASKYLPIAAQPDPVLAPRRHFLYTMPAMSEPSRAPVPKWPFFLADAIMLGLACLVFTHGRNDFATLATTCACVALGALLGVLPFMLDYRITLKQAGTDSLAGAVEQLKNLETIATQIGHATSQWQTVNEHSTRSVAAAKEIGERMATEAKEFSEFMQKTNDSEKSTLRLEVDKLRRAEADWVQVVVRMLDHTFSLHTAAIRSGKTAVIEQITHFHNAQRDAARRVGLVPFVAAPGETFDAQKHRTAESETPTPDATIHETIATGFTFQGQLVRPPLVTLVKLQPAEPVADIPAPQLEREQTLL